MDQIFLQMGSFTIRWYGVMAALGFMSSYWVIHHYRKRAGMSGDQVSSLVFISMISGILGARIFYVIQFWDKFRDHPAEIIRIDHGGLVFYGGFFLVIIALVIFCRKHKLDIWRVLDVVAVALPLGHAFGRLGCFLNGCCYGKPTECLLGVEFPAGTPPAEHYPGLHLHPVQIYEVFANLIFFSLLLLVFKKVKRGQLVSLYFIGYGIIRFVDEFFRGDHIKLIFGIFTKAQFIGLFLIPCGLVMFYIFGKHNRSADNHGRKKKN
jgi:phosphatidylglycerol---prolipoprotein diacylglyceryl transferase